MIKTKELPQTCISNFSNKLDIDKLPNISGIYCFKNKINNKIYIGSSKSIKYRISKHISLLKKNKHDNKYFQYAVNKYGIINFDIFLIEKVKELDDLFLKEQYYLDLYKSYLKNIGYNILHTSTGGVSLSVYREVSQFDLNGTLINTYLNAMEASIFLNINYELIRSCCRKLQKKTSNFIFLYSDDTMTIEKVKNNPSSFLLSGNIGKKKTFLSSNLNKIYKRKQKTKNTSKKYTYCIEVYDFNTRVLIKKYESISSCIKEIPISKYILEKNFHLDLFVIDNFIFRFSKVLKGLLPEGYHYRPLGPGLYIHTDENNSMGVYTKIPILKNTILGESHVFINKELVRIEIGGFVNHSLYPNCMIKKSDSKLDYYNIVTIRDIAYGEELTVDYFNSACGLEKICKK